MTGVHQLIPNDDKAGKVSEDINSGDSIEIQNKVIPLLDTKQILKIA